MRAWLRRRRPGWFLLEAVVGMGVALFLFGVADQMMDGWWKIKQQTRISDESHLILRAVLAPAAWDDCVAPSGTPPVSCGSAEAEIASHAVFAAESRDYYKLDPRDPLMPCDTSDIDQTAAFAVRDATVVANAPGFRELERSGTEQREVSRNNWAWTAVQVDSTTLADDHASDLVVDVAEPISFDTTTGLPVYGSPIAWGFPPDDVGPRACHIIVVPAGYEVSYTDPATALHRRCALPLTGGNPPC